MNGAFMRTTSIETYIWSDSFSDGWQHVYCGRAEHFNSISNKKTSSPFYLNSAGDTFTLCPAGVPRGCSPENSFASLLLYLG